MLLEDVGLFGIKSGACWEVESSAAGGKGDFGSVINLGEDEGGPNVGRQLLQSDTKVCERVLRVSMQQCAERKDERTHSTAPEEANVFLKASSVRSISSAATSKPYQMQ